MSSLRIGFVLAAVLSLSGCFFSGEEKPPAVPVEPVETQNELPPPK